MLTAKGVDSVLHILRTGVFRTCAHLTVLNTTWQLSQKSLKQEDYYHISVTERTMRERGRYNHLCGMPVQYQCFSCAFSCRAAFSLLPLRVV